MIDERRVRKYCRDDLSKIENYDKAIADTTKTWALHHRLELTLDGEFALSREQLKMHDMYYNRPYYELIFLTPTEHRRLHSMNMSEDTRRKISEANRRRTLSEESKKKISESLKGRTVWNKGKHHSEETCKKISDAKKGRTTWSKGKHLSEEHRRKLSEAAKRRCARKRESISHRESALYQP